jgi:hypothetical protein
MSDPTPTPAADRVKAQADETEFSAVLVDLDRGRVHDAATTALADVIEGVSRFGGKGKLTLAITVEPQDPKTFEDTGVMVLAATVKADAPKATHAPSVFYADGLRSISRDDPHRDDPFRERGERD